MSCASFSPLFSFLNAFVYLVSGDFYDRRDLRI